MNKDQIKNDELLYFNGVNGSTGQYTTPPMNTEQLSNLILGKSRLENEDILYQLKVRHERKNFQPMGPKEGVDPKKLEEAGWGIIFPYGADPAIKKALSELLQLRQEQAGKYFRIFEEADGVRGPKYTKLDFLRYHQVGPGPADPDKMPYYLLLVGSPDEISYTFQYQLDVQYAVGRIHFETLEEYVNYAHSVVFAERNPLKLARNAAFFSTANEDDRATQLSTKHMMKPLYDLLQKDHPEWTFSAHMEADATKAQLGQLLGGDQTPSLLFTSSHGIDFPVADPHQLSHQGALLCQEWPGPSWQGGQLPQDFYFAGDDLTLDQNLLGLICFSFACYSAGTPRYDNFSAMTFKEQKEIAPHSFMAQLPSQMLSHAAGGALAFIGHVDRAWGYSFMWPGAGSQTAAIESMLSRLLKGHPVGSAIEYLNQRYAEVASELTLLQDDYEYKKIPNPQEVAGLWTANNDARDYAIIGDPAVRLCVAKPGQTPEDRPTVDIQAVSRGPASFKTDERSAERRAIEDEDPQIDLSSQIHKDKPLTVSTYEASDVEDGPRTLKIQTKVALNGSLETTISESVTRESQHLLNIHSRSISQAIKARFAYLRMTQEKDSTE